MARKAAKGAGTIRKKTVTRKGKSYTYWEARITTGRNPGTGKQVQASITGKTQKEVREKLLAAAVAVDAGTYTQPERMTVGQWLDIWAAEYLAGRKSNTVRVYRHNVKNHIKPALGAVRLSELLGLTWDCVGPGTISISKQLARPDQREAGPFISPKNGKARTITPAPSVLAALKAQKRLQTAARIKAGPLWNNAYNLVFTTETGEPFDQWRAESAFKSVLASAGLHDVRFHDLRHTYAVNALRAGDDIKTVQGNLGHASAAFTLDRYGHFTERMKQDSAARMEGFIKSVLNL